MGGAHGRSRLHLRVLITSGALASLAVMLAFHAEAARSATLNYQDNSKGVPDASSHPGGVTSGVLRCPNAFPNPVGAGAELEGDVLSLDLELHSAALDPIIGGGFLQANNSSGSDGSMTEHAICSKSDIIYALHEVDFGPGVVSEVSVSCPPHTKLVGGGVEADEQVVNDPLAHQVEIGDTRPADGEDANSKPDDGWTASINNSPNSDTLVTARVACARHGTYTIVSSHEKRLPANHQVSTKALCPSGSQVTSGGVSITDNSSDLEVVGSFPIDGPDRGRVPDDGWEGIVNDQQQTGAEHTRAWAVCKA